MSVKPMKYLALGLALATLAACATPTAYGPAATPRGYGYSEQQIEQNRFRVSFRGNTVTERDQVEAGLLYRAAELTLTRGGDYFIVADRDTDSRSRLQAVGGGYPGFSPGWRYFSPRWGWRPWYDPFWDDPVSYREVTQFEANAEITMFHGQKPADNPNAYNAREVQENLRALATPPPPRP